MAHRINELDARPIANTRVRVGRDVGRVDPAERRFESHAAGHEPVIPGGMTAGTIAGERQVSPALDLRIASSCEIRANSCVVRLE